MNRESIAKIVGESLGQEQVFLWRKRRDGNDGLFIKNEIAAGLDDLSRGAGKIKERSVGSAPRHTPKTAEAIKNNFPNRDFCTIPPYEGVFVLY